MAITLPPKKESSSQPSERKIDEFISGAETTPHDTGSKKVNMVFSLEMLNRIDTSAKKKGITRTAWIHYAALKALEKEEK